MTPVGNIDTDLMMRALQLAERGLYTTTPNPRVGCVIASGGRYSAKAGMSGAERGTRRYARWPMRERAATIRAVRPRT